MPKRFTITEKWEDAWFSELKPNEKLVWNYLCDKCDLAGFWEINIKLAAFQTGLSRPAFSGALQGVGRGYISNSKYLWLRRFIEHQGNFPLNPKNNAHRHIIGLLERHTDFDIDFFEELKSTKVAPKQPLNRGPSKGNSKGKGKSNIIYSDNFEKFWKKWLGRYDKDLGGHVKVGKYDAWEVWQTLTIEQQRRAWYAADKVKGFTPDAHRWLKRKMFDDFKMPKEQK